MLGSEKDPVRSAGLVALLDLISRPAAAIDRGGSLLGSNSLFQQLAHRMGVASPTDLSALLDEPSAIAIAAAIDGTEFEAGFCDGERRFLRLQPLGREGQDRIRLLVLAEEGSEQTDVRANASLRHDLAGPLTAILGTAELMLIRGTDLPNDVRNSIGQILENCGRMSEILAHSRLKDRGSSLK